MVVASRHGHAQRSRPGRRPARRQGQGSADGQVVGALLVLGGIGWFLNQTGVLSLSLATTLSCLLIALGVGLVLTARRAGGAGLVVVGLILTVVLASTSAVDVGLLQKGVGDRTFAPTTETQLQDRYALGVGSLTLDLSKLTAEQLAGERVRVQLGVGELVVYLPPKSQVAVDVRGLARAGEVNIFGGNVNNDGGTNVLQHYADSDVPEGQKPIELELDVGLGTIEVARPRG